MLSPSYSISPKDLWNAMATRDAPQLVDVRRRDAYDQSPHLLPGAVWRDAEIRFVEGAGHTLYDPGVRDAVMRAISDIASKVSI